MQEIINQINLENLSKFIEKNYGIETKFYNRSYSDHFELYSEDLLEQTGAVGTQLFKNINIVVVFSKNQIKQYYEESTKNELYILTISFRYYHKESGSNGYSLGSGFITYNITTQEFKKV